MSSPAVDTRPRYTVPTLVDTLTRDNGLTAVSTFSGCGGSSLGLHRAGWRIPYAVEFIPAAADTYEANFPGTHVDRRDIRSILAQDILDRLSLKPGELDLFEGSPPCSSFSHMNTSESSRYGAGKLKPYSEGVKQVTDDLFDEWLRLVEGLRPRAILAENVPGLAQGKGKTYLAEILDRLRGLGYLVDAQLYNSCDYGAAVLRRRLVIRGVRADVADILPAPEPAPVQYTLGDALATLPTPPSREELEHADARNYAIGREWANIEYGKYSRKYTQVVRNALERPLLGVTATGAQRGTSNPMHPHECRKFTSPEIAWAFGYPADFAWPGTPRQRYERVARSVAPPLYAAHGRALALALGGTPA